MEARLYRTGSFAKRARVSVRTLRFYDREGLLRPTERSLSGQRLYSDRDLIALSRILGLKLMGFTLGEIGAILSTPSEELGDALARQRAMLEDRQAQVARAIRAVREAEAKVRDGTWDWDAFLRVIEAMQMNEDKTKHLTKEQLDAITEISARAYSPEAYARLKEQAWTDQDQARFTEEWNEVYAEAARLAEAGADPGGSEGRALGVRYGVLIRAFTRDDPELVEGLNRFYDEAKGLPPEKSPFAPGTWESMRFAELAYEASKSAA